MKLWDIAHSRTGDKGNISNISLIAYDPKDYALLKERVTAERVKEHFKGMVKGEVVRYELPNIHAQGQSDCCRNQSYVVHTGRQNTDHKADQIRFMYMLIQKSRHQP